MALHRGWIRLWVFASALWAVGVIGFAVHEYRDQNPFCEINDWRDAGNTACDHVLWEWHFGKTKLFVRYESNNPQAELVFLPRTERMLGLLLLPPLVVFALGAGVGWVRRGFASQTA